MVVEEVLEALGLGEGNIINGELVTQCPWPYAHTQSDRHASFSVSLESGAWICYTGCGAGGLVQLVKAMRGGETGEARRWILGHGGQVVSFDAVRRALAGPQSRPEASEAIALARADYGLMAGDKTSSYLLERGFTWETIDRWGLKYDAGNRAIVIPVHSRQGEVVGVVRRFVPPVPVGFGKYIYTAGFQRREYLFGADKYLAGSTPTILVEGVLDVIWLHQHGHASAVGLMGTYCSTQQVALLERLGGGVVLALDNDEAGRYASHRLVEALGARMPVWLLPHHEGKDVQDLGAPRLAEVLAQARYAWSR